jgi:predicted transposase YbfD/YdcC
MVDDDLDFELPSARLALLLEEFSRIDDEREPCRVMYPLSEVLLLVTCGTICSCDDFDDIVFWGENHLGFLRRFSEFHFGIPGARWLRILFNRIDPALFAPCFEAWTASLWPDRHELIAIDGKTARRTHDRRAGLKALHTLSAYASMAGLVLAQTSVPQKANEITAIPDLLDQLAAAGQLQGATVTIDAMGCQVEIAQQILDHQADYILPVKGNQPTLANDVRSYFATAPDQETVSFTTLEKGHGRIEKRIYTASSHVDWIGSDRAYPGQPRFKGIRTLVKVEDQTELADKCTFDTRYYIASMPLDIQRLARAIRSHWAVESLHWSLDITFNEDQSRYRARHGAQNMAVVRRFAFNLIKHTHLKAGGAKSRTTAGASLKSKRKVAGWSPDFLLQVLSIKSR